MKRVRRHVLKDRLPCSVVGPGFSCRIFQLQYLVVYSVEPLSLFDLLLYLDLNVLEDDLSIN